MFTEKIRLDIVDSVDKKDSIELGYVDVEPLFNSDTRLSTATAIYNLGMAVASLTKSRGDNVSTSGNITLNSDTATVDVDSQYPIVGKCSFNVSDLSLGSPANEYWKSISLKVDANPLFNSDTQIAYLTQLDSFGNGFCGLSDGKLGDGLQFNSARVADENNISGIVEGE